MRLVLFTVFLLVTKMVNASSLSGHYFESAFSLTTSDAASHIDRESITAVGLSLGPCSLVVMVGSSD